MPMEFLAPMVKTKGFSFYRHSNILYSVLYKKQVYKNIIKHDAPKVLT